MPNTSKSTKVPVLWKEARPQGEGEHFPAPQLSKEKKSPRLVIDVRDKGDGWGLERRGVPSTLAALGFISASSSHHSHF